jgi:hypothetical protein
MAQTDLLVHESAQDLVAILDALTYQPLFQNANPMRVNVREIARLTTFAVEDGSQRTDHRVINPVEISLPLLLVNDSRNLFEALRYAWLAGAELIVQTKVRSYPRMMISELSHVEAPEQGESISVELKLLEVSVITPEYGELPPFKVSNPTQASTVKKGNQQTTETSAANKKKASVAYRIFN